MTAKIRIEHLEATLEDGVWTSPRPWLTDALNAVSEREIRLFSPAGPQEALLAEHMAELLGGELISFDVEPVFPGVAY